MMVAMTIGDLAPVVVIAGQDVDHITMVQSADHLVALGTARADIQRVGLDRMQCAVVVEHVAVVITAVAVHDVRNVSVLVGHAVMMTVAMTDDVVSGSGWCQSHGEKRRNSEAEGSKHDQIPLF